MIIFSFHLPLVQLASAKCKRRNIDEAVSDIRPYQLEPLLNTASVVFNEESSDSDYDIDLDQHSQNQHIFIYYL
jgi:hypothetical protein